MNDKIEAMVDELWSAKPNRLQCGLGFPAERNPPGPMIRKLLEFEGVLQDSPFLVLFEEELRLLEQETGRMILNSGDTLYSTLLVTCVDSDQELQQTSKLMPMIDCRGCLLELVDDCQSP